MPGIGNNSIREFQERVAGFDQTYINDWNTWLSTAAPDRPRQLGVILRRWQACRPNRMRRTKAEGMHESPYLEDLVAQSELHIQTLQVFDIRSTASFAQRACASLNALWEILEQLSYRGRGHGGRASIVGISKAVLLMSDGRVGPAFDSKVSDELNISKIKDANAWIEALRKVSQDIHRFETTNNTTMQQAVPNYAHLHGGRIYDMALGPRGTKSIVD